MSELSTNQVSVSNKVDGIESSAQGLGEKFLGYLEQSKQWQEGYMEDCKRWQTEIINAIYSHNEIRQAHISRSDSFISERDKRFQDMVLQSLRFSDMYDRHSRIAEAHANTFQWIFNESRPGSTRWKGFVEWLRGDSTLYWITGKAGSGKSTLMKYLYNDSRTSTHLKVWASGVPLVTPGVFLWNSGNEIQYSQIGLLRSTLYQTLLEQPTLIACVLPERWELFMLFSHHDPAWTIPELRRAFRLLAGNTSPDVKFCYFIDGLDEFQGDHKEILGFCQDLASSTKIKVCVASRPWIVFEDAFKSRSSLMLQDLTYPDIKHYVDSHFHGNAGFVELEKLEPSYSARLLELIAEKASGVFLWVHLVVKSLLAGLANADRVSDLQRRLESLPPDLENLYEKMLGSLDPFYLEHASQIFQIVRRAKRSPTLLCLSFADEEPAFVLNSKVQPLQDEELSVRAEIMRRRLNSRCKGLLEIGPVSPRDIDSPFSKHAEPRRPSCAASELSRSPMRNISAISASSTIQYLHRTVKDFIESPDVWARLMRLTTEGFDPSLALCRSFLAQLKVLEPNSLELVIFWKFVRDCLEYAYDVQEHFKPGQHKATIIALIDELDNAAIQLANTRREDGLTLMQKHDHSNLCVSGDILRPTLFGDGTKSFNNPSGLTFLSLMVKMDFHWYIHVRANRGCFVQSNAGVKSLLTDAVSYDPEDSRIMFRHPDLPSLKMIELLFDKGADPNWKDATGKTAWDMLLSTLYYLDKFRDLTMQDTLESKQIVELFINNGADLKLLSGTSPRAEFARRYVDDKVRHKVRDHKRWFWKRMLK